MRLATVALLALLSGSNVDSFSTDPMSTRQSRHVMHLYSGKNNESESTMTLQSVVISTVTAAAMFMGTLTPLPDDTANAAVTASTAPAPIIPAAKIVAKPATPTDILASEKKAVEIAKAAYADAGKPVTDAKAKVATATVTFNKDKAAKESAEKKVKDLKKSLIDFNDKLAQAKSKSKNEKLVELLTKNVGEWP